MPCTEGFENIYCPVTKGSSQVSTCTTELGQCPQGSSLDSTTTICACNDGLVLDPASGICHVPCQDGTTFNANQNTCSRCE